MVMANCINEWVYVPMMDKEYLKSDGALMLVFIDVFTVVFLILFLRWLEFSQKKYVDEFKL